MTDNPDTRPDHAADLAFLRGLAEEGANAPMGGGRILMAAGLVYGFASLFQWAAIMDLTPFTVRQSNWIWLIATGIFLTLVVLDKIFWCPPTGVKTAANRAARAAWSCVGAGIFAAIASMAAVSWRLGEAGSVLLWLLPSLIMVFYGLGWGVSAAMIRSSRLLWLSIASFVAAPVLALMTGSPALYLAYAVALFLLMAVPGFLLMRAAGAARAKGV
jgi:hypothetical protein